MKNLIYLLLGFILITNSCNDDYVSYGTLPLSFQAKLKQVFSEPNPYLNSCSDSFSLFAPNVFTPGNALMNNLFLPLFCTCCNKKHDTVGCEIKSYLMLIKDNGQTIITITNPGTGWDGKINGIDAPEDVYDVEIYFSLKSGESCSYKGFIILVRDLRNLCGFWNKCIFGDQINANIGYTGLPPQEPEPDCK